LICPIEGLRRLEIAAQAKLQQERRAQAAAEASVKLLAPAADLGFDPRYWLSSKRKIAKRQLDDEAGSRSMPSPRQGLRERGIQHGRDGPSARG
jgi:hypothetical protein